MTIYVFRWLQSCSMMKWKAHSIDLYMASTCLAPLAMTSMILIYLKLALGSLCTRILWDIYYCAVQSTQDWSSMHLIPTVKWYMYYVLGPDSNSNNLSHYGTKWTQQRWANKSLHLGTICYSLPFKLFTVQKFTNPKPQNPTHNRKVIISSPTNRPTLQLQTLARYK